MRIDDGRQVKAARAILGITMTELAAAAGLNKNTVLRIEGLKRIRRNGYDQHLAIGRIERAIEERGVHCEMKDGRPSVTFATTSLPPKYVRRKPAPVGARPSAVAVNTEKKQASAGTTEIASERIGVLGLPSRYFGMGTGSTLAAQNSGGTVDNDALAKLNGFAASWARPR